MENADLMFDEMNLLNVRLTPLILFLLLFAMIMNIKK